MNTIKKLNDYQHVRLKNEMYFGSRAPHTQDIISYDGLKPVLKSYTWVPAVFTAFREILDNALDEMLGHGHGNKLEITYEPETMTFSVQDNGRGIPIDWSDEYECYLATLVLANLKAGRNFEERGNVAGTNGIGASGVNFCSKFFSMEIVRDGKKFYQEFTEGENDTHVFGEPKIIKSSKSPGTKITFRLSDKVFKDLTLPMDFVTDRVTEIAIANPELKVYFNGQLIKVKPKAEANLFPEIKPIAFEVDKEDFKAKFWLVDQWQENGDYQHSIVNNIPAFNGGVHVETFKRLFFANLLKALEKESKRRKLQPNRSDVGEGMLIYSIVNMKAPDFDSQSKTRLINEGTAQYMKAELENPDFYKDIIRKNKDWIETIYKRTAERTEKKDAAENAKAARKNLRNKVPRLMDATGTDRSKCILFLAEGESAIGGMAASRDPEIHGGMGMKGKVLNVNGEPIKKVLENKELADIMNSIGLIIGQKAEISKLRYGKVYVATDMDHDGSNIAALLTNFFHTYWPELFQLKEPFLYLFQTPFIIAEKGKIRKYWYSHNYHEFKPADYQGWTITRAKGLGTLIKEDWDYSLKNPEVIPLQDDGKLNTSLDLIFNGDRSDDRKEWIGI